MESEQYLNSTSSFSLTPNSSCSKGNIKNKTLTKQKLFFLFLCRILQRNTDSKTNTKSVCPSSALDQLSGYIVDQKFFENLKGITMKSVFEKVVFT